MLKYTVETSLLSQHHMYSQILKYILFWFCTRKREAYYRKNSICSIPVIFNNALKNQFSSLKNYIYSHGQTLSYLKPVFMHFKRLLV